MCVFALTVDCQSLIHSCNSQLPLYHSSRLLLVLWSSLLSSISLFEFLLIILFFKLSYLPFYTILPWWEPYLLPSAEFQEEKPEVPRWLIINLCGGRTRSCLEQTAEQFSGFSEGLLLSWLLWGIREKECCVKVKGAKAVFLKTMIAPWARHCSHTPCIKSLKSLSDRNMLPRWAFRSRDDNEGDSKGVCTLQTWSRVLVPGICSKTQKGHADRPLFGFFSYYSQVKILIFLYISLGEGGLLLILLHWVQWCGKATPISGLTAWAARLLKSIPSGPWAVTEIFL